MSTFTSAEQLLEPGETGLFLFTDGRYFKKEQDGTGSSGFWKLNPKRKIHRVVIFRWLMLDGQRTVELYVALPNGIEGPTTEDRYLVQLLDVKLVGTTTSLWEDFVRSDDLPVAYVVRSSNTG